MIHSCCVYVCNRVFFIVFVVLVVLVVLLVDA